MPKTLKLEGVPPSPFNGIAEIIAKDYYCIPNWCRMHPFDHFDGMGGCWGVSSGLVLGGEQYCLNCDYHKNNISPPKEPENA